MDDQTLLTQYAATRDAGAFEELIQRYAGSVKAVCVRILGNPHDAEEVAQECFLELARHAEQVHSSVPGWLHRAATSRSLNALRSRMRRRVREREVGIHVESPTALADITTVELHRIIEATLQDLPDDLRQPMILHYFDGRSQREMATELGVNQSTISRRMRDALQQLREKLTQAGYVAVAPAIAVLTPDKAALAAHGSPISKIAASGMAAKTAGSAAQAWSFNAFVAVVLPILSFLVFGGWISLIVAACLTLYVARFQPIWVREVFAGLGVPDIDRQPTFCLAKWNWTTPPQEWRITMATSLMWSVLYICLAIAFAAAADQPPWGTVVAGVLVGIGCAVHAWRIFCHVHSVGTRSMIDANPCLPAEGGNRLITRHDQISEWRPHEAVSVFDAIQLIAIGLAGIGIASQQMFAPQSKSVLPSVILAGTIGSWMLHSGIRLCRQLIQTTRDRLSSLRRLDESSSTQLETTRVSPYRHRAWRGMPSALMAGVALVVCLSTWVAWNPAAVRGLSVSLAAIQTSMLGWMVYRVAAHCRQLEAHLVRRIALILLVSCFVLNSGVCVASWLQ